MQASGSTIRLPKFLNAKDANQKMEIILAYASTTNVAMTFFLNDEGVLKFCILI